MIVREFTKILIKRFDTPCNKIQVILGPRQVGKTTGIKQFQKNTARGIYFSADAVISNQYAWLEECFNEAIRKKEILIIDEIQKIENWSEKIKELWDNSKLQGYSLDCILLGSSSLELNRGLTESLTGRYELIKVSHWSYSETKKLNNMSFEDYLVYGGYPGSYEFITDFKRWRDYLTLSIVDNVITKDILLYRSVKNVPLFKQAFDIVSNYPSSEISYTKLLGQIQDKGNTELVKNYLSLYEGAFLLKVLDKYSEKPLKRKTSSPKILHRAPAFYGRIIGQRIINEGEIKGMAFETVIGNILVNEFESIYYWREKDYEVDFVVEEFGVLYGFEVKSGRRKREKSRDQFLKKFPKAHFHWITLDNFEELESSPRKFIGLE